jgi:hypothetical protein
MESSRYSLDKSRITHEKEYTNEKRSEFQHLKMLELNEKSISCSSMGRYNIRVKLNLNQQKDEPLWNPYEIWD